MLSDRSYMRDVRGRPAFSALTWLIGAIAGGYVVENIFHAWIGGDIAERFFYYFTLSPEGAGNGLVWTLLSHALIHDPKNILHLGVTLLLLFTFGRLVSPEIGQRRLLLVFTSAVLVGGLVWLLINWNHSTDRLYGASAGISALIMLNACLAPYQPITFFMIDVGLRAKHLALALLTIDMLGLFLLEIPGRDHWFAMSHSAHLGGMAAGWFYFQFLHQSTWTPFGRKSSVELPRWFRKARKADTPAPAFKVNLGSPDDMRAEIDRILDKINSDGFQSLTAEEKRHLDHAREHLTRR